MKNFLAVCLAGAIGTGLRYLVSLWFVRNTAGTLPWGILAVNLAGSFLLGAVVGMAPLISPTSRAVLGVGLLGGFTTYSSFNQDTLGYALSSKWALAALNVGGTVVGCLLAGGLGLWFGRLVAGPVAVSPTT